MPSEAMRMSRSPQNGGFHKCTGGGPFSPARLTAPVIASSPLVASPVISFRPCHNFRPTCGHEMVFPYPYGNRLTRLCSRDRDGGRSEGRRVGKECGCV